MAVTPRTPGAQQQPQQLQRRRAAGPVTQLLDHESLGQPLHEQQRDAAQDAHDGQQHLVQVAAADDEREVEPAERQQPAHERHWVADGQGAGYASRPGSPSRRPVSTRHHQQQPQLVVAGPRPHAAGAAGLVSRPPPLVMRSLQAQPHPAQPDLIAEPDRRPRRRPPRR